MIRLRSINFYFCSEANLSWNPVARDQKHLRGAQEITCRSDYTPLSQSNQKCHQILFLSNDNGVSSHLLLIARIKRFQAFQFFLHRFICSLCIFLNTLYKMYLKLHLKIQIYTYKLKNRSYIQCKIHAKLLHYFILF